jgi:hypothetical protein
MDWQVVEGVTDRVPFHNFKEEPVLEGIWKGTQPNPKFDCDDGVVIVDDNPVTFIIGKVLVGKLAVVPIDATVRITYMGQRVSRSNGNSYYDYKVEVAKPCASR